MSLEEYVHSLSGPPEIHSGYDASVQWLDAKGTWLVSITEPYKTESGEYEVGPVWQRKYGDLEAPTAYQALMIALSEKRSGL